ncbi:unnamed protein product [Polarella glacialis]|uniref:RING-CH-type domain-containing protein n=1 Tax=Polarella glacialis TaxID=89957 RepID=A0A813KYD9_POLGL|nr:unnamed protein product [Polarella glacialis]
MDVPVCRFCLESDCQFGDDLLSPCGCRGTSRYVHCSCLDHWRISGFDPKTVTHCGTCKAQFKLQQPDDAIGAQREVWAEIVRYIGFRVAIFWAAVVALGFVAPRMLGVEESRVLANSVLNHLTIGTLSTFALSGGYVILQLLWSVNIMGFHRFKFDSKHNGLIFVIVIVVGALYLLYKLAQGAWEIAQTGPQVASAGIRHTNKEMRRRIVERYPVMNYEAW